jgi:hypothetical protein
MTFGFADDGVDENKKEFEWKVSQFFRWQKWEDFFVDMRVRSILTGTKGVISKLDNKWKEIYINWDNGKKSLCKHKETTTVVVIDE